MITGFLIAYALFTSPLIAWGVWNAVKDRKSTAPSAVTTPEPENAVKDMLTKALADKGFNVKVHELPRNATEAVMSQSRAILDAIENLNRVQTSWLTYLKQNSDANKIDMAALLQSNVAVTKGVTTLIDAVAKLEGKPGIEKSIDSFVNSLEYARDKFATTQVQRKAVESIIKNVKTTHGTEQK